MAADGLAGRICAAAADAARSQYVLLELIGKMMRWRVEALDRLQICSGLAVVVCSMTPQVAREHVRVATALRPDAHHRQLFKKADCLIRRSGR